MPWISDPKFDDSTILENLGMLAFQVLEVGAVAGIEKYVDFFADQFEDNSGVDAVASLNEEYDAVNDRYQRTQSDLCSGGAALSGGDNGGQVKALAFDDDPATFWESSQSQPGVSGVSYIGYDFGVGNAHIINRFTIKQHSAAGNRVLSVKVDYSDNGVAWTTLETKVLPDNTSVNTLNLTNTTESHRYWRLLANAEPGAGATWAVYEVEFMNVASGFTLVSNAVEAESNDPLTCKLLLLIDLNSLSITENTDLLGWISIDDGTNWEAVTLEYKGVDGTGRAIYSGDVNPAAQGDKTIRAKLQTLNSKDVYAKAWAVFWKYL